MKPITIWVASALAVLLLASCDAPNTKHECTYEEATSNNPPANCPDKVTLEYFLKSQDAFLRKDYAEEIRLLRKAADRGYPFAEWGMGNSYYMGLGVPKDITEALRWYYKAAEQKCASAEITLGRLYFKGEGVPKDDGEALRWFNKVLEDGDSDQIEHAKIMINNIKYHRNDVYQERL